MRSLSILWLLVCLCLATLTSILTAQVTIGSTEAPVEGALLDLKNQPNGTSNKGLGLPRVVLTDINKLYPMLPIGYSSEENEKHIGLVVYNQSYCDGKFNKGVYVWSGDKWQPILDKPVFATPSVNVVGESNDFIDIPSGLDARGASIPAINIAWGGLPTFLPTGSYTNYENMFRSMPLWVSGVSQALPSSDSYVLQANAMNETDFPGITTISPWYSRQWQLNYNIEANECGPAINKTITLNQTNYALKVNDQLASSKKSVPYLSTSFTVEGNVKWTTSISDPKNIISNTTPPIGTDQGQDKKEGTTVSYFPGFEVVINGSSSKYDVADITFKDTQATKRFDDITVSVLNCSGVEPTLEQWKTRAGLDGIAKDTPHPTTGVAWHEDQNGNIFFSADFGADASSLNGRNRWMITNLAATSYASGVTHAAGRSLNGPLGNPSSDFNVAYWAYPSDVNPTNATAYNARKRLGLLYTWDAATAGKGGVSGQDNNVDEGGVNLPKTQGICPNGWHLPNDYEWTMLENEIQTNTSKYSYTPDIGGVVTLPGSQTVENIGIPMKDCCEPSANEIFDGSSNLISKGGFNVMLAGYSIGGFSSSYSYYGTMLTSSSKDSNLVYTRGVNSSGFETLRGITYRYALNSVRCKKD